MPVARLRRSMRGMTLVEILVVVLIIGILAALATLSIGLLGDDREIEDESRRLADAIALLQEQAQLEGRDFGILLETARYEFQRFDAFEQRWVTVEDDPALRARELPPDLAFELSPRGPRDSPQARAQSRRAPAATRGLGQRGHDSLPSRDRPQGRRRASRWSARPTAASKSSAAMNSPDQRGFTLVEVVVALAIVAIGMMAVFKTIGDTVHNVTDLRDRSFRHLDRRQPDHRRCASPARCRRSRRRPGEVEFAGRSWHWVTKVSQTQVQGLRRIDVSVRRDEDPENASLVDLAGFVGATATASPTMPVDWHEYDGPQGGRGRDEDGDGEEDDDGGDPGDAE